MASCKDDKDERDESQKKLEKVTGVRLRTRSIDIASSSQVEMLSEKLKRITDGRIILLLIAIITGS